MHDPPLLTNAPTVTKKMAKILNSLNCLRHGMIWLGKEEDVVITILFQTA